MPQLQTRTHIAHSKRIAKLVKLNEENPLLLHFNFSNYLYFDPVRRHRVRQVVKNQLGKLHGRRRSV